MKKKGAPISKILQASYNLGPPLLRTNIFQQCKTEKQLSYLLNLWVLCYIYCFFIVSGCSSKTSHRIPKDVRRQREGDKADGNYVCEMQCLLQTKQLDYRQGTRLNESKPKKRIKESLQRGQDVTNVTIRCCGQCCSPLITFVDNNWSSSPSKGRVS